MNRTRTMIAAAAIALMTMSAAHADPSHLERTVNFADLDLSQSHDVQRLYTRLRSASKSVCAPFESRRTQFYRTCMNEALEGAVAKIGEPRLTEFHRSGSVVAIASR